MKKIILAGLLSFFLIQCGGKGTFSEPRLVGAGFGMKDKPDFVGESPQALKKIAQSILPKPEGELTTELTNNYQMPVKGSFIVLSFSQILEGDLIETIVSDHSVGREAYENKIPVVTDFKQVAGIVEITESADGIEWKVVDANFYIVSYRAEGGFVPMPDVPVYLNPGPAIRIDLATGKEWPKNKYILVRLMNKYKNKNGTGIAAIFLLKTES